MKLPEAPEGTEIHVKATSAYDITVDLRYDFDGWNIPLEQEVVYIGTGEADDRIQAQVISAARQVIHRYERKLELERIVEAIR